MPSPKRQPAGLKILNGRGAGKDSGGRTVKKAPGYVRLAPEPPEWMSAEAAAEWQRVVPELQRLELIKPLDRAALTAYCETWSRYVNALMAIKVDGLFATGSQGQPIKNPAVMIAESCGKELRAWCAEFGFTPSAESNMNLGGGSDDDDDNPFAGP